MGTSSVNFVCKTFDCWSRPDELVAASRAPTLSPFLFSSILHQVPGPALKKAAFVDGRQCFAGTLSFVDMDLPRALLSCSVLRLLGYVE